MDIEHANLTPGPGGARHARERDLLWTSSEGQAANAGTFVLALLTFWLVAPVFYAVWRFLRSATTRYTLTDQRLLVQTGIVVRHIESLELYRVKDLSVTGTLILTAFGRGRIVITSTDATTPVLTINAIANPQMVAHTIRNAVEYSRMLKGVRAFDY